MLGALELILPAGVALAFRATPASETDREAYDPSWGQARDSVAVIVPLALRSVL